MRHSQQLGVVAGIGAGGGGGFDPATMSLTGWWRADFGSAPWSPTASAGASGSNGNLITSGSDPSAGATVNGHTPADFSGSNILVSPNDITTFCTTAAGSYVALVNFDTASATSGNSYSDPCVMQDSNEDLLMTYATVSGTDSITATAYQSGYKTVTTACTTGAWHAVFMWWDSTDLHLQIDSGSPSSAACATLTVMTGALQVGRNGPSAGVDGRIAEIMTIDAALSGTDITNLLSYFNTRYGLSL